MNKLFNCSLVINIDGDRLSLPNTQDGPWSQAVVANRFDLKARSKGEGHGLDTQNMVGGLCRRRRKYSRATPGAKKRLVSDCCAR